MTDPKNLTLSIVSPEGVLWQGTTSFAVLPALDGELGLYPDHAPLLARLGVGECRIHTPEGVRAFALFGGFLQVLGNRVQVLVDRAEAPGDIDTEAASRELEALASLERRDAGKHEEEILRRRRAQVRLRVAARKR